MDDESRVRATPGWTMRQLMAHVVGVCVDLVNGNVGDWAEPNWTGAGVGVASSAGAHPRG